MRSWFYCTVLVLAFGVSGAVPVKAGGQQTAQTASSELTFKVFVKGTQVGSEQVTVTRTADGIVVSGSGRLAPPVDMAINRCEMRYDAAWKPLELTVDGIVHGNYTMLHTVFAGGTATSQVAEAGKQATRTAKIGENDVVLLSMFFGLYETLAARLSEMKPPGELRVFFPPSNEIPVSFTAATEERIQTPARTIPTRHFLLTFHEAKPVQVDIWADTSGRLVRMSIAAQSFEMLREDAAAVGARRETAPRAGDEPVRIPANGFSLAGTVATPGAGKPAQGIRYPAVVLVAGAGVSDRDELTFDIPIFAQLAAGLADGGYMVVRYDKRGVGQSGGRADAATLDMYAEDARAVVDYMRNRKDVDPKRIVLAGYGEGGWVAMRAAERNNRVAAVALIATPGTTGPTLTLEQQEHSLDRLKLPPAERQAKIDLQKKIQNAVLTGKGWESIPSEYKRQADTPWYRSFLEFDPAKVMQSIRQPILILQGDLDQHVFKSQADALAKLASARKPPADKQVTVQHLAGVNHLLVPATTGEPDEYPALSNKNVSKELLASMLAWMQRTLPAATK